MTPNDSVSELKCSTACPSLWHTSLYCGSQESQPYSLMRSQCAVLAPNAYYKQGTCSVQNWAQLHPSHADWHCARYTQRSYLPRCPCLRPSAVQTLHAAQVLQELAGLLPACGLYDAGVQAQQLWGVLCWQVCNP